MTALEQQLASLIPGAAAAEAGAGGPGNPQHTLSAAMQRRIHHNIQLAARCARLDAQKQALEAEKADLSMRLEKAQVGWLVIVPLPLSSGPGGVYDPVGQPEWLTGHQGWLDVPECYTGAGLKGAWCS